MLGEIGFGVVSSAVGSFRAHRLSTARSALDESEAGKTAARPQVSRRVWSMQYSRGTQVAGSARTPPNWKRGGRNRRAQRVAKGAGISGRRRPAHLDELGPRTAVSSADVRKCRTASTTPQAGNERMPGQGGRGSPPAAPRFTIRVPAGGHLLPPAGASRCSALVGMRWPARRTRRELRTAPRPSGPAAAVVM